jgi:hypothetical protein
MAATDLDQGIWEVLHASRIRGRLQASSDVPATVLAALDAGTLKTSRIGYVLTPAGLVAHRDGLQRWRSTADLPLLEKTYTRFLSANVGMKTSCFAWQSSDRGDQAGVTIAEALAESLARVTPALNRAEAVAPRFGDYAHRLEAAHATAVGGDSRFFTDPTVDSFHNVWFECHEDYLVSLDRSREEEGSH